MTAKMQLRDLTGRMPGALVNLSAKARRRIDNAMSMIGNLAGRQTEMRRNNIRMLSLRLDTAANKIMRSHSDNLKRYEEMVRLLDPGYTLRRGYSITRVNGHAITDASRITKGTVIETRLADGSIKSEVIGND